MGKFHFFVGLAKTLFNKRISFLSFISSRCIIDKTCVICRGVKIKSSKIGSYSYVSACTDIENAEIGKFCSIADHCRIGMSSHSLQYLSSSPLFTQKVNALREKWTDRDVFEKKDVEERVFLGNDVWVGSHALINGGVHVGDGACIAAGAVVVKDVPSYAIVGGVPAKVIKYRFEQRMIDRLVALRWWDFPVEKLKSLVPFFQKETTEEMLIELERNLLNNINE
ncbi:MAG: CatB-related O-acetyltransferase [Bacteroidaceae bacterium]|nr:CatB-related O-acetyltransferase [Bacteroidaceae bacterium]